LRTVESNLRPVLKPLLFSSGDNSSAREGLSVSPFSRIQTVNVVTLAMLTGVTAVLQPVLLGALAEAGRLSLIQIGYAATIESIAMAAGSALTGAFLKPEHLRRLGTGATSVLIIANIATAAGSGNTILLARLVAGLATGVVLWIYAGLLTRVPLPARVSAIQSLTSAVLALVFSMLITVLLPRGGGGSTGYVILILFNLAMLALARFIPRQYAPIDSRAKGPGLPRSTGLIALGSVGIQNASVTAVWIYALPIGRAAGLDSKAAGLAISTALLFKLAGAFAAIVCAKRLRAIPTLFCAYAAIFLAMGWLLYLSRNFAAVIAGLALLTFMWMFGNAFQMPFLVSSDPSGRAPMQIFTAQLLGLSLGPSIASTLIGIFGISASPRVGMVLMLIASSTMAWAVWRGRWHRSLQTPSML
jgi:DHA1 family inner membrane transport protein